MKRRKRDVIVGLRMDDKWDGDKSLKIRFSVNKHGRLFKVVNHPNGDVVMLAQHAGEFARWDAGWNDGDGIGYIRHASGAVSRIVDRLTWQEHVKVTASMMRSE